MEETFQEQIAKFTALVDTMRQVGATSASVAGMTVVLGPAPMVAGVPLTDTQRQQSAAEQAEAEAARKLSTLFGATSMRPRKKASL